MTPIEGWREIVPPNGEEDEPFIAKGAFLPDGAFLLVGHDAHALHDAVELVEEGIIWMLAIAVPLSLLTAIVSSALIFRRLEAINRLSLEIRRGHLDRRLPVGARNDEFDRLAAHLNGMLDGIQDLTESLRQVTNNIAHELRTPLTRIHNKVEAARRQSLSIECRRAGPGRHAPGARRAAECVRARCCASPISMPVPCAPASRSSSCPKPWPRWRRISSLSRATAAST